MPPSPQTKIIFKEHDFWLFISWNGRCKLHTLRSKVIHNLPFQSFYFLLVINCCQVIFPVSLALAALYLSEPLPWRCVLKLFSSRWLTPHSYRRNIDDNLRLRRPGQGNHHNYTADNWVWQYMVLKYILRVREIIKNKWLNSNQCSTSLALAKVNHIPHVVCAKFWRRGINCSPQTQRLKLKFKSTAQTRLRSFHCKRNPLCCFSLLKG